jgi:DNA-binding protein Fis
MILICLTGNALNETETKVAVNQTVELAIEDWYKGWGLNGQEVFQVYEVLPTDRVVRPRVEISFTEPQEIPENIP